MRVVKLLRTAKLLSGLVLLAVSCLQASLAWGANPRWTTGPPYFTVSGTPVVWYTNSPVYYTDPADLSPYVNHAAADAMVAAAANVWNVPTSMITLAQGGVLNEHLSGTNVFLGQNGLILPADVDPANYATVQIAVLYDTDGSVTNLLLGGNAADPSGCRQHGVTESVDSIATDGTIRHALLLINGRCTGAAPEAQMQLQYQLERAFGRILGLGWSQLNDNVFMGFPQPTYTQALHWPIMHPIDLICGLYTYQCLPEPFTLRDDDISSITALYPVTTTVPPGKQNFLTQASYFAGNIRFPNREGQAGVNVVVVRNNLPDQFLDDYEDVSAVTGAYTRRRNGNPITPRATGMADSFGEISPYYDVAGYYALTYIPIATGRIAQDIVLHTEALNPLYTGEYAIGPYAASPVTPSGETVNWRANYVTPFYLNYYEPPVTGAAGTCSVGGDGVETAPAATPASGWWTGVLCGQSNPNTAWDFGHTAWMALTARANRSFTVEMTGLDEAGQVTGNKLRPVLGIWHGTDAAGTPPSVASQAVAFNALVGGMTTLSGHTTAPETLRLALASETGDGRPDYNYQGRVLYADTISPASAGAGTSVTLTGMGFRPGNVVKIGGVTASVASWTATAIVATVPRLAGVPVGGTTTVDISVTDLSTQGTTTMGGAFQYIYTAPVYTMQLVTAPAPAQVVSLPAAPAFAVRVLQGDGVTPLVGAPVVFSTVVGTVTWGACAQLTCTVATDATGTASTTVTASAPGAVTLQAAAVAQSVQASFNAVPLVRAATVTPITRYLAAGATASWTEVASFTQQTLPASAVTVAWTATGSNLAISASQTTSDANGQAQATVTVGPLASGATATGMVCGWGGVCANFSVVETDPTVYSLVVIGGGAQVLANSGSFVPVMAQVVDGAGNPVAGVAVTISQTVRQWVPPCASKGRCPPAPIRQSSRSTAISDITGLVTITPLDAGGAETDAVTITCGKHGSASLTLQRNP